MTDIREVLKLSPVIPVAVIPDGADAVALARALLAGGVPVIEVTLRTPGAVDAIARIAAEVPEVFVGAGTVWTAEDAARAIDAGARFVVSPGRADSAMETCRARGVPYLPGVQTVSEAAHFAELGLPAVKFFPASVAGGVAALKALSSVLPNLAFCPTGGISAATAPDYLALPSVPCVGGSWVAEQDAVAAGDWSRIESLAAAAQL